MKRVAVIGGGPAGLMAAVTAARKGLKVDLFDAGKDVGRKILASGNGRCNISNVNLSFFDYHSRQPSFVNHVLNEFDFKAFEKFCISIGLLLKTSVDGRVYPQSNEARSIQQALKAEALRLGVQIFTKSTVFELKKNSDYFVLNAQKDGEIYEKVVLAAGSPAAPQLGGSNSGLQLAMALGHDIIEPYPALVGLHLEQKLHKKMRGVKIDAALSLYLNGKCSETVKSDLLFTDYGISGFGTLDISTLASKALKNNKRVEVEIDLLPLFERQHLVAKMGRLCDKIPDAPVMQMLHGVLPRRIAAVILHSLEIEGDTCCKDLNAKELRRLATKMKMWRFRVIGTHGYEHAEAAGGGVATEEVNPKTMESKIVPGLYLAGEVLDVVGKRGGYNLHFAWASGWIAGKNI